MKKVWVFLFAVLPVSVFAQQSNNISMVTYFPVPYVSYSQVNASQQMDIGLTRNACELELGCSGTNLPLDIKTDGGQPGTLNVNHGILSLEPGIGATGGTTIALTESLELGSNTDSTGDVTLKFNQVYIPTLAPVYSSNSDALYVDGTLQLFESNPKNFPVCNNSVAQGSNGQMEWAELALGKGSGKAWYLTCGGVLGCEGDKPSAEVCTQADAALRARYDDTFRSQWYPTAFTREEGFWCSLFSSMCTYSLKSGYNVCGTITPKPRCACNNGVCGYEPTSSQRNSWALWDRSGCQVYNTGYHLPDKGGLISSRTCSSVLGSDEWKGNTTVMEKTDCHSGVSLMVTLYDDVYNCVHTVTTSEGYDIGQCPAQDYFQLKYRCSDSSHVGNSIVEKTYNSRLNRCYKTRKTCTAHGGTTEMERYLRRWSGF